MICPDGSFRIMDFGIARSEVMRRLTFGGLSPRVGTPDYMAPEQVKGKRGDARTDGYGLGAMLYEMVTGHTRFEGETDYDRMTARLVGDPAPPRRHNPGLSPQVEEIILHALARHPADRYPSAAAFKADLEAPHRVYVTGRAARLRTPVPTSRWWRVGRNALLAMVVPVLLFFVFLLVFSR
jgi:serine/threonine-protein kinase